MDIITLFCEIDDYFYRTGASDGITLLTPGETG